MTQISGTAQRYQEQLASQEAAAAARKKGRLTLSKEEIVFEDTPQTRLAYMIERFQGFPCRTLNLFMGEIKAGGHTGQHRHSCEAAIYVLAGQGYSIIDGDRYDWAEGGCMLIPAMCWHQHFNASDSQPARYLAVSNYPQMEDMGLAIMEQKQEGTR